MLDQREEVIVIGLLKAAADGEGEIDRIRSKICEDPDFEPYSAFKSLQSRPMTSGLLTARDVAMWLKRQYYKTCLLREAEIQAIFEHYGESGMLRYESFLKMVLPREDRRVRSMVMCRRTPSSGVQGERDLGRDAGYHFIRLLEQEAALNDELTLRKKRLLEYEWREDREHLNQRAFSWLQSESAVPGVVHVSVLGVCRLLCDVKEVLTVTQVERLFHRINLSGSDMLSYAEFCEFLKSTEADAYLNELYVKYYSTMCPGCGSMCQRDGGACNNVTCPVCRTTFRCETIAGDGEGVVMSPRQILPSMAYANNQTRLGPSDLSPRTPKKTQLSPGSMNRSVLSTAAPTSPGGNDLSFSTIGGGSPRTNVNDSVLDRSINYSFNQSLLEQPEPRYLKTDSSISVYQRQKKSLYLVADTMLKMLEIDSAVDLEKEHLWQNGVNAEASFEFMDRYGKGYIADTDVCWGGNRLACIG